MKLFKIFLRAQRLFDHPVQEKESRNEVIQREKAEENKGERRNSREESQRNKRSYDFPLMEGYMVV
jgi:hypothetical protein